MTERIVGLQLLCFVFLAFGCGSPDGETAEAKVDNTSWKTNWPKHVIDEGYANQTASAADFTGDGLPDVIVNAENETRLYVAPDWKKVVIGTEPIGKTAIHSEVIDVDADGDPDYIGAVYSPGPVFWLERPDDPTTTPWPYHLVDDEIDGTHGLITGDVNGDGTLDLIANSAQPKGPYKESIVWYEIPEKPREAKQWIRHVFADKDAPGLSHYMGVGDVTGDGKADISAAAKIPEGGNWFAWWEQPANGSDPWKKHVLAMEQEGATNILIAELSGDGKADFIASRGHGKGILWFKAPDFKLQEINPSLEGPHSLAVGDIDGDGDTDAATCAKDSFIAAWFENDGSGNFTTHHINEDQAAYDIRLVDIDSDGDLDVLIAGQESKNVVWYENRRS